MGRRPNAPWIATPLAGIVVLFLSPVLSSAQLFNPPIRDLAGTEPDGVDAGARTRIALVDAYVGAQKWSEAVESLQKLGEEFGEKLIRIAPPERHKPKAPAGPPAGTFDRYVTVRDYCQLRLAALPVAGLTLYRERVDPQAREAFERGKAERNIRVLEGVAQRQFVSSYGDDALFTLGELALADGDYDRARACWRKLLPRDPTAALESGVLAYPDTDLDLAGVYARLTLVSILEGSLERAQRELNRELPDGAGTWAAPGFAARYPQATGRLGGKQGLYAEQLTALLAAAKSWPADQAPSTWTTFAGSTARMTHWPKTIDVAGVQWRRRLPQVRSPERPSGRRRVAEDRAALLSYHPVVAGDGVFVAAEDGIYAFDMEKGGPLWATKEQDGKIYPTGEDLEPVARVARPQSVGAPRFTMTVHGRRLFARVGSIYTNMQRGIGLVTGSSSLICLDLNAQGRLLWKLDPEDENWAFEGPPVCDGRRVYAALRYGANKPQGYVAAYDIDTSAMLWRKKVCGAETLAQGALGEITHNLLTLVRDRLYYNTNLGAVAALDTRDGAVQWATTYPRATGMDPGKPADFTCRDLNPCVVHQGVVIVAPSDSQSLFALDADTGQLLWETSLAGDAVHLLGVAGDRLIATGNHVYWIRVSAERPAAGGKVEYRWPDQEQNGLAPRGRGLLAGGFVYWPTEEYLFVFHTRLRPDMQVGQPLRWAEFGAAGGNLAATERHLLVAQPQTLACLTQFNAQAREALQMAVTARPTDRALRYQLARHAEAAHDWEAAAASYLQTMEQATPEEKLHDRPLADAARERLVTVLVALAAEHEQAGRTADAAAAIDRAALHAASAIVRLACGVRAGDLWAQAGEVDEAVARWQRLLAHPELSQLDVEDEPGHPTPVRKAMARRISAAITDHGRSVYAAFDAEAQRAFAAATAPAAGGKPVSAPVRLAALARVANDYPQSLTAQAARERWGREAQVHGAFDQAVQAWSQCLRFAPPDETPGAKDTREATALVGGARAYEGLGYVVAARYGWELAAYRHSRTAMGHLAPDLPREAASATVASFVAARLAKAPFLPKSPVAGGVLWRRTGDHTVDGQAWLPRGVPPDGRPGWLGHAGDTLTWHRADGRPGWKVAWPVTVCWCAYTPNGVLVVGPRQVACLGLQAGDVIWRRQFTPTTRAPHRALASSAGLSDWLHALAVAPPPFQSADHYALEDGVLYACQGSQQVWAIAAETGDVLWGHAVAADRTIHHLTVCGAFVTLALGATDDPQRRRELPPALCHCSLAVLRATDGELDRDLRMSSALDWRRRPQPLDRNRMLCVPDETSVACIDLDAGRPLWRRTLEGEAAGGPPDALVVGGFVIEVQSGRFMARLNPQDGTRAWREQATLGPPVARVRSPSEQFTLDGRRVYCVAGGAVQAYSMSDGRSAWLAEALVGKPETDWRLSLTGGPTPQLLAVAQGPQPLELVVLDPAEGGRLQRIALAEQADQPVVALYGDELLIASRHAVWRLTAEPAR